MKDIIASLKAVDSLLERKTTPLSASTKKRAPKKATPKRRTAKASARRKAEGKSKKLTAARRKMLAEFGGKPNLKKLHKVISRGLISADEVVMAIEEALKLKRVNPRLAETIAGSLRDVFDISDIIDVGETPLSRLG